MDAVILSLLLCCMLAPAVAALYHLIQRRRSHNISPLTDDLQRLPAHSLAQRQRRLTLGLLGVVMLAVSIPAVVITLQLLRWIAPDKVELDLFTLISSIVIVVTVAGTLAGALTLLRHMHRVQTGMEGEMATAQLLTPLLAKGWELYHDIPFKRGNLDHVLVGPGGVFAIETKYRSKLSTLKGEGKAKARYDGTAIHFPGGHAERLAMQQAKAVSKELSKELSGRLNQAITVKPVVALPGWFVESSASRDAVQVINPKNHYYFTRTEELDEPCLNRLRMELGRMASA